MSVRRKVTNVDQNTTTVRNRDVNSLTELRRGFWGVVEDSFWDTAENLFDVRLQSIEDSIRAIKDE